jgi:hypothetical protein
MPDFVTTATRVIALAEFEEVSRLALQRLADHVECRGANGASPSGLTTVVRYGSLCVRLSADAPHANRGVLAYPQRPSAACPPPSRDRAFVR